jgi:cytochrome c oxidase cbb3-type subunit I/II
VNPQSTSAGSIMPEFKWLFDNKLDISDIEAKMKVMQTLGSLYRC